MRRFTGILAVAALLPLSLLTGQQTGFFEITVAKGQTLSLIAQRHLKNAGEWRALLKYNSIATPNLIHPGRVLKIPDVLARTAYGYATFVRGDARLQLQPKSIWTELRLREPLYQRDVIRTTKSGRAVVVMRNAATVRVMGNTTLELQEPPRGANERSWVDLRIAEGLVEAFVRRGGTAKRRRSRLRVVTPSATAMVRGTQFITQVRPGGDTTVACQEGKLDVMAGGETVELPAGFATIIQKGRRPQKPFRLLRPPVVEPLPLPKNKPGGT